MSDAKMKLCNRCGKCCYHDIGGGELVKCPYLVTFGNKTTWCRIYKTRLKTRIKIKNKVFRCVYYSEIEHEIKGCPLNEGKKREKEVIIKGLRGIIK